MARKRSYGQGGKIDARIISLESQGMRTGLPTGSFQDNRYCTFSYYDTIAIKETKLAAGGQGNPLDIAYKEALGRDKSEGPSQFILAFIDIVETGGRNGYAKEEIAGFWKDERFPLLFMTMVNIGEAEDIKKVLRKVKTGFKAGRHLAYFTFDHSDLIIFYKGDSFKEYADLIFQFNYKSGLAIYDTITLYSFCHAAQSYAEDKSFRALISFGIRDYSAAEAFYQKVEDLGKEVQKAWLLGRNDMSIYCESATLKWLSDVRNIALESQNNAWYTTYDLLIPISPNSLKPVKSSQIDDVPDVSAVKNEMARKYESFRQAYVNVYTQLGLAYDTVWLRWLKESSELSADLLGNALSGDLGVCLAPQFLGLFEYGEKFFNSAYFNTWESCEDAPVERALESEKKRNKLENIDRSFAAFFADMAILIDSMNQTNRQFVQIPSFHLPSFDIPPKIMALYVALSYRLRDVFHDDGDVIYELVLLPKYIRNLGILSLAEQEVLPEDQWLEVMFSEPSFYFLQMTMETLGHEISHFAGQKNRCRDERRDFMVECALALYLIDILKKLPDEAMAMYPCEQGAAGEAVVGGYALADILNSAKELYVTAKEVLPERFEGVSRRNQTIDAIGYLLGDFSAQQQMFTALKKQLWELECGGDSDAYTTLDYLRDVLRWEHGFGDPMLKTRLSAAEKEARTLLIDNKFLKLVWRIVNGYEPSYRLSVYGAEISVSADADFLRLHKLFRKMSYYFSETFADLQMILLFEMDWRGYCELMRREEDITLIADCPLRMLAVAKALVSEQLWTTKSIKGGGAEFKTAEDAAKLDLAKKYEELDANGFSPVLLYYLCEYLKCCIQVLKATFKEPTVQPQVQKLRKLHFALSDDQSAMMLQKEIRDYVDNFRRDFTALYRT